jgi:hypothetical protein
MTGKGLPKREANISSPAFAGGRGRFSEGYVCSINLKIKCQYQLKFLTSWLLYKNNMNHFHNSSLPAACLPPVCRLSAACLPPVCRLSAEALAQAESLGAGRKPWRRQKALAQAESLSAGRGALPGMGHYFDDTFSAI